VGTLEGVEKAPLPTGDVHVVPTLALGCCNWLFGLFGAWTNTYPHSSRLLNMAPTILRCFSFRSCDR